MTQHAPPLWSAYCTCGTLCSRPNSLCDCECHPAPKAPSTCSCYLCKPHGLPIGHDGTMPPRNANGERTA